MGTSNFESNVQGKDGTQTLTNFATISGTTITATGTQSAAVVTATSYIKIGTAQYIFYGDAGFSASIAAEATALVGASVKGSLYLSGAGGTLWVFNADTTATKLNPGP